MKNRIIFLVCLLIMLFILFFCLYFLGFVNLFMRNSEFLTKYKWLDFGKPIIALFYLIILSIFFIVIVSIMYRLITSVRSELPAPAPAKTETIKSAIEQSAMLATSVPSEKKIRELFDEKITYDESEVQGKIDTVYQNISQMTSEILQCIDISELFEKLLFWGADLSHSKRASIMVTNKNKELYIYKTMGWSIDEKEHIKDIKTMVGVGLAGKVAQDNKRLFVPNIDNYEGHNFIYKDKYKSKSFICLPIFGMHRVVAVLNLTDNKNGYYNISDLESLNIMTNIASKIFELIQFKRKMQ